MDNKKDSFIKQAGILAAAGILVRIIGILYRSPLYDVIGPEGNGYYATAYNIYAIILLISSYSIPSAVSKVMAQKIAVNEYKTAQRIFRCSVIYVVIVGAIASVFAYCAAPMLLNDANGINVLRVFAPTIFFSGLLGVLRGYFQARKTMVKTSVSQILEQIFNAVFSVGMAYLLMQLARSTTTDETKLAVRGAMGSAIGTGTGVVVALIFMYITYMKSKKEEKVLIQQDQNEAEPYGVIFKIIILTVTPIILSTFIYNISITMNQKIFASQMEAFHDMDQVYLTSLYGFFSNSVTLTNIPIAMASAMAATIIPNIATSFVKNDIDEAKYQVNKALRVIMLIGIPSAVGLGVLSELVIGCMYRGEGIAITAKLLSCMAFAVVFYCLSTLTNAVLQGIGKVNQPVKNAVISLIPQTLVLYVTIRFTEYGLLSLVLASTTYSGCMCLLNGASVKKYLGYKQNIKEIYIKPLFAAAVMGIFAWIVSRGLEHYGVNHYINLVVTMCIAIVVYGVSIIKFHVVDEETLMGMPKGAALVRLAKKAKLM